MELEMVNKPEIKEAKRRGEKKALRAKAELNLFQEHAPRVEDARPQKELKEKLEKQNRNKKQ